MKIFNREWWELPFWAIILAGFLVGVGIVTLYAYGIKAGMSAVAKVEDPTERGLCYVALAILIAAFVRGRGGK